MPRTDEERRSAAPAPSGAADRPGSRAAYAVATAVVALRWLIVAAAVGGAVAAYLLLPAFTTHSGGIGDITTSGNPAIAAETQAAQAFGFPVLSRTVMVQRDPAGLPQPVLRRPTARPPRCGNGRRPAAPTASSSPRCPSSTPAVSSPARRETRTTIVTYLYPNTENFADATQAAQRYAARFGAADHVVGVTGTVPGSYRQTQLLGAAVPRLEVVSVAAVILIVGLAFRSVVAPLLTLLTAGVSYIMITRVARCWPARLGVDIPPDLEPLMVALMVGVITDYVVYFLAGLRGELWTAYLASSRPVAASRPSRRSSPPRA